MPSRFLDNGDGTITDSALGTMWQKEDDGEKRTYDEAIAYSEALDLGGYGDWRLSNRQELMKLAELGYDHLRRTFPNIRKGRYWVATSKSELAWAKSPDQIAYTVDFDPGSANYGLDVTYFRHYAYYVRCTRTADPVPGKAGLESKASTGAHRRKRVIKAKPSPKLEPTLDGTSHDMTDKLDRLIRDLRSSDDRVRWDAAQALGESGDARAVEPLIRALKDDYDEVRSISAKGLKNLKDARAVEPLIRLLAGFKCGEGDAPWDAAEALGEIGGARAVEALIHAFKRFKGTNVSLKAALALARMGDAKALKTLIGALRDKDEWTRKYAAQALGESGDARAVEPLIEALKDRHWDRAVRRNTADALKTIKWRLKSMTAGTRATILCGDCLCRFTEHRARLGLLKSFSYYACSHCHGSLFVDNVTKVVAILDHSLDTLYVQDGTTLLANWYHHKEHFDFDEIRIKDASDSDIDELVMKLKNDMDKKRSKRYRTIPVHVSPQVQLSQAQMNMLRDSFGRVERMD